MTGKWQKHVTRRLAVQVGIAWNFGYGRLMEKKFGKGIRDTLVHFDGGKTDYFVDKEQCEEYHDNLDALLNNPKHVKNLIPEAKVFVENTKEFIKKLIEGSETLTDEELARLYKKFSHHHAHYYTRMWTVFRICERIVMKIETNLRKTMSEEDVKKISSIFATPLEPNDVTNERINMLKISITRENKILAEHSKKFMHIPMFDFDHEPYSTKHFENELKKIENPEKELREIEESFENRKNEFKKALKKINPKKKLENLIFMLRDAVILRDYRDMVRQKLNLAIRSLYKTIGDRIGLDVKDTALLTNEEIFNHLYLSLPFPKILIEDRKKAFLLIQLDDKVEIFSGESAKKKVEELALYKETEKSDNVRGIPASSGKVKGIVRIVNTNLDLHKVQRGDILIATMTRQDFVPAMRKAKAIVTDEGGLTCHAAIIARELGLPCVVGTENGTKILKDGDFIEVDGEKGRIKIIQK